MQNFSECLEPESEDMDDRVALFWNVSFGALIVSSVLGNTAVLSIVIRKLSIDICLLKRRDITTFITRSVIEVQEIDCNSIHIFVTIFRGQKVHISDR